MIGCIIEKGLGNALYYCCYYDCAISPSRCREYFAGRTNVLMVHMLAGNYASS